MSSIFEQSDNMTYDIYIYWFGTHHATIFYVNECQNLHLCGDDQVFGKIMLICDENSPM